MWYEEFRKLMPIKMFTIEAPDPSIKYILKLCHKSIRTRDAQANLYLLIEKSIDRIMELLNIGNWKDVPIENRQTITILSFYLILLFIEKNDTTNNDMMVTGIIQIIDKGLLFGAPLPHPHENLLQKCASILKINKDRYKHLNLSENLTFDSILSKITYPKIKNGVQIEVQDCPSVESFYKKNMIPKLPTVLKNCINNWPALDLWKDPLYLIQNFGHRTVPVEIGSKYTDSDWTQKLMLFSDFINEYMLNDQQKVGYLAQHQMFDQIPELMKDFYTPDYCSLHVDGCEDDNIDKNAWFGPVNTVSPLHTDPKHNLLSQVVGEKLVILFCPQDAPYLYCHEESLLQNTAQVDPIKPNHNKYPLYSKAKPQFCILKPGDILYIPPKWWHYVKSLTISFSVSFWWN